MRWATTLPPRWTATRRSEGAPQGGEVGRRAVLRPHTFAHRTDALLDLPPLVLAAYRPWVASDVEQVEG